MSHPQFWPSVIAFQKITETPPCDSSYILRMHMHAWPSISQNPECKLHLDCKSHPIFGCEVSCKKVWLVSREIRYRQSKHATSEAKTGETERERERERAPFLKLTSLSLVHHTTHTPSPVVRLSYYYRYLCLMLQLAMADDLFYFLLAGRWNQLPAECQQARYSADFCKGT